MGDRKKKSLEELTFKDNFMFAAVMMDEVNAKGVLETTLDIKTDFVKVSTEKSMIYHPEYRGVRLDAYIQDADGRHFDVEMQVAKESLEKRSRYYHSQMDMDLIATGTKFKELPESYVVFICDFDPFGLKKYRYTVRQTFHEDGTYEYIDGSYTVFLSTKGENASEEPEELVKFLEYVASDNIKYESDDELVKRLQHSVEQIKFDREMGRRYMLFEEIKEEEFKAGKAEGIAEGKAAGIAEGKAAGIAEGIVEGKVTGRAESICELLAEIEPISENLRTEIYAIKDLDELSRLLKKAAVVNSIKDFEAAMRA